MAWQHDPTADEWVWVDQAAEVFEPSPRLTATAPVAPPSTAPAPADDGDAFLDERTYAPKLGVGPMAPMHQDEDQAIITRWEREVRARGNEVRVTSVGTFEVDADGRIVSEMPSPYRTV